MGGLGTPGMIAEVAKGRATTGIRPGWAVVGDAPCKCVSRDLFVMGDVEPTISALCVPSKPKPTSAWARWSDPGPEALDDLDWGKLPSSHLTSLGSVVRGRWRMLVRHGLAYSTMSLFLLTTQLVQAQPNNFGSTKAQQEFARALTAATFFGVPRYTTVALPTCNSQNTGAVAFNTTSTFLTFCNGTAWGDANSGAASAITPGSTTIGTATNCFAYADGSSVLQCDTSFVANNSGAGNGVFTVRKTVPGDSAFTNFLSLTGTLPTIMTAQTEGSLWQFTSAGSSAQPIYGLEIILGAGYTGASQNAVGYFLG